MSLFNTGETSKATQYLFPWLSKHKNYPLSVTAPITVLEIHKVVHCSFCQLDGVHIPPYFDVREVGTHRKFEKVPRNRNFPFSHH